MFSLSKPELSETKPMPVMHSTAAITLFTPGFLLYTAHARNGTSTQYVAVRRHSSGRGIHKAVGLHDVSRGEAAAHEHRSG